MAGRATPAAPVNIKLPALRFIVKLVVWLCCSPVVNLGQWRSHPYKWRKGRTHPLSGKYRIFCYVISQCYRPTRKTYCFNCSSSFVQSFRRYDMSWRFLIVLPTWEWTERNATDWQRQRQTLSKISGYATDLGYSCMQHDLRSYLYTMSTCNVRFACSYGSPCSESDSKHATIMIMN